MARRPEISQIRQRRGVERDMSPALRRALDMAAAGFNERAIRNALAAEGLELPPRDEQFLEFELSMASRRRLAEARRTNVAEPLTEAEFRSGQARAAAREPSPIKELLSFAPTFPAAGGVVGIAGATKAAAPFLVRAAGKKAAGSVAGRVFRVRPRPSTSKLIDKVLQRAGPNRTFTDISRAAREVGREAGLKGQELRRFVGKAASTARQETKMKSLVDFNKALDMATQATGPGKIKTLTKAIGKSALKLGALGTSAGIVNALWHAGGELTTQGVRKIKGLPAEETVQLAEQPEPLTGAEDTAIRERAQTVTTALGTFSTSQALEAMRRMQELGTAAELTGLRRQRAIERFGLDTVQEAERRFQERVIRAKQAVPGISPLDVVLEGMKRRPLTVLEIVNPQTPDQAVKTQVLTGGGPGG